MRSENESCDPQDIATKSFFLGPQAENGPWFEGLMVEILDQWLEWRRKIFPQDGVAISERDQTGSAFRERQERFRQLALELSRRFEGEIPKFSPRYMGHMLSEISLPALLGHWIATLHNPNNISAESAPIGVVLEKEAILELVRMAGLPESSCGHFTSCGSIANFEAVLRARDRISLWLMAALRAEQKNRPVFELAHQGWSGFESAKTDEGTAFREANPLEVAQAVSKAYGIDYLGPVLLVPENRHYSWVKAAHLLGLGLKNVWPVALDKRGTLSLKSLRHLITKARAEQRPIALIASVLGTTELGNFDPVHEIQSLVDDYSNNEGIHLWHHVDAAYGGYFLSLKDSPDQVLSARSHEALRAVSQVNSFTIDPHKLGYVPYACGAFICRDHRDYMTQSFESPYIQYSQSWDPGQFTMEGSRSASGAAATWLTMRAIGSGSDGYGRIVGRTVQLRRDLGVQLTKTNSSIRILPELDSNIICFTRGEKGEKLSKANEWVKRFYEAHSGPRASFFVSKTALSLEKYKDLCESFFADWQPVIDTEELHLLRLTLMNPFIRSKEMNTQIIDEFCREVGGFGDNR